MNAVVIGSLISLSYAVISVTTEKVIPDNAKGREVVKQLAVTIWSYFLTAILTNYY